MHLLVPLVTVPQTEVTPDRATYMYTWLPLTIHSWPGLDGHKAHHALLTIGCRRKPQMQMHMLHSSLGAKYTC